MKLEINIDENFLQSQLNLRTLSFSKALDVFRVKATHLRKYNKTRVPTYILDNKLVGYDFANICNVPTPKILQAGVPLEELKFVEKSVIKPMHESSSRGIFIAHTEDKITYLNKGTIYSTPEDAKKHAFNLLQNKLVKKDNWMVEELLTNDDGIARDVKFYCFYGQTGLILETERETGIKRCWYDSDLNYVNTGKYTKNPFNGNRDKLLEVKKLAEALSLEIPAPFVRIDFLLCNGKAYLGEFTPAPGNYAGFNNEWDQKLGELYLEATTQLCCDVAHGKIFNNYNNALKSEKAVLDQMNQK